MADTITTVTGIGTGTRTGTGTETGTRTGTLAITEKELTGAGYRQYNSGAIAGASCIYRKIIPWGTGYTLWCAITWFPEITKSGSERPEYYGIEFALAPGPLRGALIKLQLTGSDWAKHPLPEIEEFAVKFADRMQDFISK